MGGLSLLIDCGLFQERRFLDRNWAPFSFDPKKIDFVLFTHAHLDHCGLLPKLIREGYTGPILATRPTIDLARLVMEDSVRIQKEDAKYKQRRHRREGRTSPHPVMPLYDPQDAIDVARLFQPIDQGKTVQLNDKVSVRYMDAGHILGSSISQITAQDNGTARRLVFSGDLGQWDSPLMNDPSPMEQADYVVMESTYGDEEHAGGSSVREALAKVINHNVDRGGKLFVKPPTIRIFDADCQAAGMPKTDERGRVVDIHALRHTFGTHLSASGVHPRTAMAAMRHSRMD